MKKITIVDYGVGNILSLSRAIREIGYETLLSKEKKTILSSDILILPGVGAFQNAMKLLRENHLEETLDEYVKIKNKPLIGICLGMQMLLSKSNEMGEYNGLNYIPGEVVELKKLSKKNTFPH